MEETRGAGGEKKEEEELVFLTQAAHAGGALLLEGGAAEEIKRLFSAMRGAFVSSVGTSWSSGGAGQISVFSPARPAAPQQEALVE